MISVCTALALAVCLHCEEVVLYLDFHSASSIWYLTFIVLTLFSNYN